MTKNKIITESKKSKTKKYIINKEFSDEIIEDMEQQISKESLQISNLKSRLESSTFYPTKNELFLLKNKIINNRKIITRYRMNTSNKFKISKFLKKIHKVDCFLFLFKIKKGPICGVKIHKNPNSKEFKTQYIFDDCCIFNLSDRMIYNVWSLLISNSNSIETPSSYSEIRTKSKELMKIQKKLLEKDSLFKIDFSGENLAIVFGDNDIVIPDNPYSNESTMKVGNLFGYDSTKTGSSPPEKKSFLIENIVVYELFKKEKRNPYKNN